MSEKEQIIFMQTRIIRLASQEWHLPVERIIELFIESAYGIFHCEGDEAVLEDISEMLDRKGVRVLF